MAVHLLDTEILIDFLRGRGEARAFVVYRLGELYTVISSTAKQPPGE